MPSTQLKRYNDFVKRGIDFTPMQMHLMFFPRGYGKTFMSMCKLCEEACKWDKSIITFETQRGNTDIVIIPDDEDCTKQIMQEHYIKGLRDFIHEYYPEFSVRLINKRRMKLIKKRLIRVSD